MTQNNGLLVLLVTFGSSLAHRFFEVRGDPPDGLHVNLTLDVEAKVVGIHRADASCSPVQRSGPTTALVLGKGKLVPRSPPPTDHPWSSTRNRL